MYFFYVLKTKQIHIQILPFTVIFQNLQIYPSHTKTHTKSRNFMYFFYVLKRKKIQIQL